jgi:predicted lactoylglutathione lyase
MQTRIFVNLPVKNLPKSIKFFTALGFKTEPHFTDDNAACIIFNDHIAAMLLTEKFFKTFTKKDICETKKANEVILGLSMESRKKVDKLVDDAIKGGATSPGGPQDQGWMYQRGFKDLDGHLWEVFFMDENAAPKNS